MTDRCPLTYRCDRKRAVPSQPAPERAPALCAGVSFPLPLPRGGTLSVPTRGRGRGALNAAAALASPAEAAPTEVAMSRH